LSQADSARLTFDAAIFQVLKVFPTPVVVAPVSDPDVLNTALRQAILSNKAAATGVAKSNDGRWQSQDDFASWSGRSGEQLLTLARQLADQLTAVQTAEGLLRQPPVWTVNAWANVNAPGDRNHAHHHAGGYWSGVYWVDAGEATADTPVGGEFEMNDPRGILPGFSSPSLRYAVTGCLSAGLTDFIVPKSGTMIMFPSWLVHGVRPYRGQNERISVAFNFSPDMRPASA
jgi:uncharacterized protein (TIGR02466 family)